MMESEASEPANRAAGRGWRFAGSALAPALPAVLLGAIESRWGESLSLNPVG